MVTVLGGTETIVDTKTAGLPTGSTISTLSDGRWVVTWISGTSNVADRGAGSQVFHAEGSKSGSEIAVFTSLQDIGFASTTAPSNGGMNIDS